MLQNTDHSLSRIIFQLTVNLDNMCIIGPDVNKEEINFPEQDTILQVNFYCLVLNRCIKCDEIVANLFITAVTYLRSLYYVVSNVVLSKFNFYRPRTYYDGRLYFYRCLSVNIRSRGYPISIR